MRFLPTLLIVFCALTYVLFDSKALEFEARTLENAETVQRAASVPVFRPSRLGGYFDKLIHKIGK